MSDLQRKVALFARHHQLQHDVEMHALDLVSEVGELVKEVLLATDYGRRPVQSRVELENEVGDTLYSLLAPAEACRVDAEAAVRATLRKYERRLRERGDASSA